MRSASREDANPGPIERVRIAEFKIIREQGALRITGLGSCVALALYETDLHLGGLAHILLPGPAPTPTSLLTLDDKGQLKYADRAINALLHDMLLQGADRHRLVAKIAGGANMFTGPGGREDYSPLKAGVGERNVESVRDTLGSLAVPIVGEDVGGKTGRNIYFDVTDGRLCITSLRGEEKIL